MVSEQFREVEDGQSVSFTFRGEEYSAVVGTTAFGHFDTMTQAADKTPSEPFCGRSFDTPVALVPAGTHTCPSDRRFLPIMLHRAITILGEAMGVSPNAPEDISKVNPARICEESILRGSFYFGTLSVLVGVEGILTVDGLTLDNFRVNDRRTTGKGIGIRVKNCIILGSHHNNSINTNPLSDSESTRTVEVSDCRSEGFDSMDGAGRLINVCATDLTIERVYYANTKEFFGLTDYSREESNAPAGAPSSITVRDCVLSNCSGLRALNILLPEQAKDVSVTVEGCVFRDWAEKNVPAIHVNLPNESCTLSMRNTTFISSQNAPVALLISGSLSAPITLENITTDGVKELLVYQPPRRTQAPASIGEVVWDASLLDDPHTAVSGEEADAALNELSAMYSGRFACHGDMHTHTNSGGTSDGDTPLGEFVKQLRALGLDFAAIVDHRQIRHCLLPEWDDTMLICGTEPGTVLVDPSRPMRSCKMDYCMLFQHPSDYFRVMEAFPEYNYTGGPDGHNISPRFTPERLSQVSRFIYSLGGLMVHAHPKQLMASDEPMDYYFGEYMPLETILGHPNSFDTVQNLRVWEALLKLGKRVHTHGDSDTHAEAKNCALTTLYARERKGAEFLRQVRDGDCSAGSVGIQMSICGTRMGSSLPYRDGLILAVRVGDYYRPNMPDDTVYCLKVYTEKGLAYASEFDGKAPQTLTIPVQNRMYYRVEITNESDGTIVAISNPIWLD